MPAISTGRNAGSARGRSAGRHKTKRDVVIQHRQTVRQTQAAQRAAAPANRRAQAEKERKDVLTKTAGSRQLGERSSRAYEPKTKPRETGLVVAGPRGMTITKVQGPSTADALKAALRFTERRLKKAGSNYSKTYSKGGGTSTPQTALASAFPRAPEHVVKRTVKDFAQMPAQIVPSAVQTTKALNELRKGNDKPAKELLDQFDKSDPLWNAAMAGVKAASGNSKEAKRRLDVAIKQANEHPGLTFLEVFGAKGALGRGITRGASTTAKVASGAERLTGSKTAGRVASRSRKVASTERATKTLPGTNLVIHRQHTRDAFQRLADRKRDKQLREHAAALREQAKKTDDPLERRKLEQSARRWDPDVISNREVRRAVDEHVDASEQTRRAGLSDLLKSMRKDTDRAQHGGPLASILAQKITKADIGELKAYRDRLIDEGKKFGASETAKIQANRTLVEDLSKAIEGVEKGKVDLGRMQAIAERYIERSRASQQELIDRKLIDPHEAERAALTPHAVVNMDARREPETLQAFATAAGKKAEKAANEVKAAKGARRELTGTQRSQRARSTEAQLKRDAVKATKGRKGAVGTQQRARSVTEYMKRAEGLTDKQLRKAVRAEDKRVAKAAKADARLKAAKERSKKAKTKASKAKDRATRNPLVLPGGKPLTTEAMRASAEGTPAFISNRPRGIGKPYVGNEKAPKIPGDKRSGEAAAQGLYDAGPDTLHAQEARTFSVVHAFDDFQRLLDRFGFRDGEKLAQRETFKDADALARELEAKDGRKWVAVRANPLGATKDQLNAMLEGTHGESIANVLQNAAKASDTDGPWVVLPHSAMSQMSRHMSKMDPSDAARVLQALSTQFRRTVLSLAPTWILGNTGEAVFRSVLNQVGPRSYLTGRRALKDAPKVAERMGEGKSNVKQARLRNAAEVGQARTVGSGRTALINRAQMHRDRTQLEESFLRDVGDKFAKVFEADAKGVPLPPKFIRDVWDGWTHFSMNMVNRTIENAFQTAMLGKAIRSQRSGAGQKVAAVRPKALMTPRMRELSAKAAEEQAKGILNENTAAALGREVDRMYGRYSKMSPEMRSLVANYTPFIAWTINAAKFIARLPVDNPTFTAVSAALEQLSEEWRAEHGLDMFLGEDQGQVPLWLQGSVPGEHGEHYRAPTRYTPLSLGTDPGGTVAQNVLPQLNGVLMALRGLDWKGDKLKDKDGKQIEGFQTWKPAVKAFLESQIPGLSLGSKIKKKGGVVTYLKDTALQKVAAPKPKGGGASKPPEGGFDFDAAMGGGTGEDFDWEAAGQGGGSSDDFDWAAAGY